MKRIIVIFCLLSSLQINAQTPIYAPVTSSLATGNGVFGYVPRFGAVNSGSYTIVDSKIYQGPAPNNFVGIGAAPPSSPLHVKFNITQNTGIKIEQLSTSASILTLNQAGGGHDWQLWSTGTVNSEGAGNFLIKDNTSSLNRFFISGTNGNIGIGTTAPAYPLDITGEIRATGDARLNQKLYVGSFQPAVAAINAFNSTGQGGLYVKTTNNVYNTAIEVDNNNVALSVINSLYTPGTVPFAYKQFFAVYGNGNTFIEGDITNTQLMGTGNRNVIVDANGKLMAGSPVVSSANWIIGGNSFSGFSNYRIGTTSNDHFELITNNIGRIQITDGGHMFFGDNPGYATGDFEFNKMDVSNKFTIGAVSTNSNNIFKSSLVIANQGGGFEFIQDITGIGRLKWGTSDLLSFKGENMMIGTPDATWDAGDINTKLVITTNSANGYTGYPLKIKNPSKTGANFNYPNHQNSIFEVLLDGTTHIGNNFPTGTHADAKLSVDGKVVSQSLYITASTNWADFVFDKSYKLIDLSQVENYYMLNKHLPGVPSEKEINENGYDINQMDATLLKKIEELTIYVVELKKEIELMKKTK